MNDGSWVLNGVDPAARGRAVEEAARRGLSVGDYLTDVVLRSMLADQVADSGRAAPHPDAQASDPQDGYAVRHRLQALKRRLGSAADSLDGAIDALDNSLAEIAGRVGEIETMADDTAHAVRDALKDMAGDLSALRVQVSDAERAAAARDEINEAAHGEIADACVGLARRIAAVEAAARDAGSDHAALSRAHEALKRAVTEDLDALTQETARLDAGLGEVRAAAQAAADQADVAAARALGELRGLREALEAQLADAAADTRTRMQAAFADAAERIAALGDRLAESERQQAHALEHMRARAADAEDRAQSALEETAETLRQADAALAGALTRVQKDAGDAIAVVRAALVEDMTELRRQHAGGMAQLSQTNAAVAGAADQVTALRQSLERRIAGVVADAHADLATTQEDWDSRFEALSMRFAEAATETAESHRRLGAETHRVEACTLAALEKLSADIAAGAADVDAKVQQSARAADTKIEHLRKRLEADGDDIREQHAGVAAHLERLNGAVSTLVADIAPMSERLMRLEQGETRAESDRAALFSLAERVGGLEQRQTSSLEALRADIAQFVDNNDARLTALEAGVAAIDPHSLAEQFAALRDRVEERLLAAEQRSVRMLEQVAETVVLLDRRLNGGADQPASKSA